ncbi:MAG: hypothetical protein V4671_04385, partial [Armatimonadota bacterium]
HSMRSQKQFILSLRPLAALAGIAAIGAGYALRHPQVGPITKENGYIVATGQQIRPAGQTLSYGGRPVDIAAAPNGESLYLKDNKGVVRVNAKGGWRFSSWDSGEPRR